jgi:N-acetylglucosamine-6-phosphate deacetylase
MAVFTADKIFDGEAWHDLAIITGNGLVKELSARDKTGDEAAKHFKDCFMLPAMLDLQIYGAFGKLLAVYPDAASLFLLEKYCRQGGAAWFMPTVATNTIEVFHQCIDAVRAYWKAGGKAALGLHLEGPWISKKKKGAHREECIHPPERKEVEDLLAYGEGVIKMITLAPEVCSQEIIDLIISQGIVISAGHSDADYETAIACFDKGISTVTHLYNAMSPLQHRAPGLVGATLMHNRVRASIIADGYHVNYAAVSIAAKIMKQRLFAITDAVTETGEGLYLHSLTDGDRYECNGVLSGSALTMHQSFLNLVNKAGIEMEEASRMCSLYPAQAIGKDRLYGKIAPGYAAQFLVLDKSFNLVDLISG